MATDTKTTEADAQVVEHVHAVELRLPTPSSSLGAADAALPGASWVHVGGRLVEGMAMDALGPLGVPRSLRRPTGVFHRGAHVEVLWSAAEGGPAEVVHGHSFGDLAAEQFVGQTVDVHPFSAVGDHAVDVPPSLPHVHASGPTPAVVSDHQADHEPFYEWTPLASINAARTYGW